MTNEILEKGKELSEILKIHRQHLNSFKDKTPLRVYFPDNVRMSIPKHLQEKVKSLLMEYHINRIYEVEKEFEEL